MTTNESRGEQLIKALLLQLTSKIASEVAAAILTGQLRQQNDTFFRWRYETFEYGERGVANPTAHGEYLTKPTWARTSLSTLSESIKQSHEYAIALQSLSAMLGDPDKATTSLERLRERVLWECLPDSASNPDVELTISTFLTELRGEPVTYGAEVWLDGVVIVPRTTRFEVGGTTIVLRQTTRDDLEHELPFYGHREPFPRIPTAIMDIQFRGHSARDLQRKVEESISVLRLFMVASARYLSYEMRTESVLDIMADGQIGAGRQHAAYETGLIREDDAQRLEAFWQTMVRILPQGFRLPGEGPIDHLTIAYDRYSDALLTDTMLEKRMASAVMGLESLFLKSTEKGETDYRFRTRTAKVLSVLGQDPRQVRACMKDAYDIRSQFVHGGQLAAKEKEKISKKHPQAGGLLRFVLDCLRRSLVACLLLKMGKDEFVALIDDSLVESSYEKSLEAALEKAKITLGAPLQRSGDP